MSGRLSPASLKRAKLLRELQVMVSTTATFNEQKWLTGDEQSSVEKVGRLFYELIRNKTRVIAEQPSQFRDYASQEELQGQISDLNRQWISQEVSELISQIGQCCNMEQGVKITARLHSLRGMLKEEEGMDADISSDSLRALLVFFRRLETFTLPELSLTPKAEVYLRWKAGPERLFAVHFENHRRIRFTVFFPNPRHSDFVNRLSGIETVDTVLQTADNVQALTLETCHKKTRNFEPRRREGHEV